MSRRRMIAIVSAGLLLSGLVIAVLVVLSATQTAYGRERVRDFIASRIAASARGKWHLGKVTGGLLGGFDIDSLEIRDADDSLFIASGPIHLEYDFRDIFDRRILLRKLEFQRLVLNLTQHSAREWNFNRLFRKSNTPRAVSLERRYEDFIRAEELIVHDGRITLSQPWRPDTSLTGARRDSVINVQLARKDAEIVRVGNGFARIRRFNDMQLTTALRWTHPDSVGRFFNIADLDMKSSDPPLDVRKARGTVLVVADSIWINARKFDLPASTGSLAGKITMGSGLPTRYALTVKGDSVSLKDVNWIYRPLPLEGGGSVQVAIRNNPQDLRIIEYVLTSLDLRTTGSHLKGGMTFGAGSPLLRITNVDLTANPLDFRFIEHMGGKPMPVPWKGQFVGRARGIGGPVDRFFVADMEFTFHDANVPLAMSTGTGAGELDITRPAETIFRGFDVNFSQLDLRTIEFLFPSFPRIGGTASGKAHLDSLWRDVRFSEADFQLHRGVSQAQADGSSDTTGSVVPSRFTGSGRITAGVPYPVFDVDLVARPISFANFSYGYPQIPFRGQMNGPIAVRGTLDQLNLNVAWNGASGGFGFVGVLDNAAPGFSLRGRATANALDMKTFLARAGMPTTRFTGSMDANLGGDSLANLRGSLTVRGDASTVEEFRVNSSHVALRFADGKLQVDSGLVRAAAGTVRAERGGSIGLVSRGDDSVVVHVDVDSLRLLSRRLSSGPIRDFLQIDSLSGRLRLLAAVSGSTRDPDIRATFAGDQLSDGYNRARSVTGSAAFVNAFSPSGRITVALDMDSSTFGGLGFRIGSLRYTSDKGTRASFRAEGRTNDGTSGMVAGRSAYTDGANRITLDSLRLDLPSTTWELASPGRINEVSGGYSVESLELRGASGGRFSASGSLPASGTVDLLFLAERIPVVDMERMARVRTGFSGIANMELGVRGTRDAPELSLTASVDSLGIGDVRLDRLQATARYSGRRLTTDVGLYHKGSRAISINTQLPIDLRIQRVATRFPDEGLSGSITAINVPITVLEAFFPQLRESEGRFSTSVTVGGTWKKPRLVGPVTATASRAKLSGLGMQLRDVNAAIDFTGDSAVLRRFSASYDGGDAADTASLAGHVVFSDHTNPEFDINFFAHNFRVVNLPRVADLYINSGLRLTGRYRNSALRGYVNVDRGALFIPELRQKRLVSLSEIDSSLLANREFTPPVPSALLQNLELRNVRVAVGDQVWLRSVESNASIQLGGEVSMTSVRVDSTYRLALEGTLSADRGDYRLDLGVVQRKFQVESGSTVTFLGEPELNPTLNISAVHLVRGVSGQDAGRDIRVRVRLLGSLSGYNVSFESADGLDLSQSDLISYLITGSPSFELGAAGKENFRTALAILLPSLGTWIGDRVVGSRFDSFQLELALGENERLGGFSDVFKRTRVGVGKQLGSRTFLSANTNFCQLGGLLEGQSSTTEDVIQSIGVKVEQRFPNNFSVALSAEPSTAALRCAASGASARGVISSPPQLGFDIFKIWRW